MCRMLRMHRLLSLLCVLCWLMGSRSACGSYFPQTIIRLVQNQTGKFGVEFAEIVVVGRARKAQRGSLVKVTPVLKKTFVDAHNNARSTVKPTAADMIPVEWDNKIAKISRKFVKKCAFIHSDDSDRTIKAYRYPLGENLFAGNSRSPYHIDPAFITGAWDEERKYYKIKKLSCKTGKMCGHYTQVVWSATRKIGCAIAKCLSLKGTPPDRFDILAVCHYGPTGNWRDEKPYKIGKPCSSCPEERSNTCNSNLCY